MEISTDENEKLVRSICDSVREAHQKKEAVHDGHRLIYEIDCLLTEVNSGASFGQYFRWSSLAEIARIVSQLETVGLTEVAQITGEAVSTAYPDGLPPNPDNEESLSNWDGSEEQEDRLSELAELFTDYNGMIINKLADYIRCQPMA
jgi:hypothetical protein